MTGMEIKRRSNTGIRYVNWGGWYDTPDGRGLCLARWMSGHQKHIRNPRGRRRCGSRLWMKQNREMCTRLRRTRRR